jgi:hypothetical protein
MSDSAQPPIGGLFDGSIRQANQRERGQATSSVYRDLDDLAFQPDDGARIDLSKRGATCW